MRWFLSIAILPGFFAFHYSICSAEKAEGEKPSLQQQIDELKKGQQAILKELDEIKALLQQRSARSDFATRPAAPEMITVNVHGEPFRGQRSAQVAVLEYY